jgi:ankyrin repeat protein
MLLQLGLDPRRGGGPYGSCLHIAVQKLSVDFVMKLISFGLPVNLTDIDKNTPLHIIMSIFSKDCESAKKIAELLILNGANINQLNKDFWSPFHLAVKKNQVKAVIWAIQYN